MFNEAAASLVTSRPLSWGASRSAMLRAAVLCCAFLAVRIYGAAEAVGGNQVLVLLGELAQRNTHSKFFQSLSNHGFVLTFQPAGSKDLRLQQHDEFLYDKVVVMGSSISSFGSHISATTLLEFVESGRDIMLAVNPHLSDDLRDLASDLGVDMENQGTAVHDHFHRAAGGDPGVVTTTNVLQSKAVFGDRQPQEVAFNGVAATISPDSTTAWAALSAEDTAYSAVPGKSASDMMAAGTDLTLAAIVQARNNARAAILGSIDMCSNELMEGSATGNEAFCTGIALWAFSRQGVLQAAPLRHQAQGASQQPALYRIKDEINVEVDIQELRGGRWQPYRSEDLQLEFIMLDPHVRTTLHDNGKGTFSARFKAPDVYGVFKFVIEHKRLGYSSIEQSVQIPVRPFRHDEFERFLSPAYPYYAGAFSVMAAFFLLGLTFLYSK